MPGERVFVGLGANLGDTVAALHWALDAMAALPSTRLVAASGVFRSAPIDAVGPDFVNAVAEIATALEPRPLLLVLQQIESHAGRQRRYHHAPRTLDLDLLLYGQRCIEEPELTVPHPRLHLRAFVLMPLLELAPGLVHPRLGPLAELAQRIGDQRIERMS